MDGEVTRKINPLEVGWNHCNAVIVYTGEQVQEHTVEICMAAGEEKKKFNVFSVMFRSFEIADCEITTLRKGKQNPDLFLEPDLGDMVQFKFKDMDKAFEIGYQTGKEYAGKIKELINN